MLTEQQQLARRGKMTASRVSPLMTGDAQKILRLYSEFIGEVPPEDLSHIWRVRLGEATEQLQLDWYSERNNVPIIRRGEVVVHPEYDWAAATLDGWESHLQCPIEAKFVLGYEPADVIVDRYQPQMQWQMWVTNSRQCAFSVIRGGREPVVDFVERAQDYIDEMVRRAEHFMLCVAMREPPVVLEPVFAVKADKVVNMTGNNMWAGHAEDYKRTRNLAEIFEGAKAILKSLVPEDAKICFGHGIKITRDRRGALHVKEEEENGHTGKG